MEFMQSGPEIVRSDYQSRLLDRWAALRLQTPLPIWPPLDAVNFPPPFDNLVLIEVVGDSSNARFRIVFQGATLAATFASVNCIGRFIDDFLPPAYRNSALATYRHVVETKLPAYTSSDMRDPAGRIVQRENLYLPFSLGGVEVERVLVSIEVSSPEGTFELREMMTAPTRPPVIALCATIQY
jgi:hypothetical protein